jgi:hypothetical protein
MVRALIYPLIGILRLSTYTYSAFGFSRELAVTIAGLLVSSLIGLTYGSPWVTVVMLYSKRKSPFNLRLKNLEPYVCVWILTIALIGTAETLLSPALMIVSTVGCVLLTLGLSATLPGILVVRKLR